MRVQEEWRELGCGGQSKERQPLQRQEARSLVELQPRQESEAHRPKSSWPYLRQLELELELELQAR